MIIAYHATSKEFEVLDPAETVDGGLHFGSEDQARMRGGPRARLLKAEIDVSRPRRSRDQGGRWADKIRSAKSKGFDAIVYLNRYEGIPVGRILEAQAQGVDLNALTDAQFRRAVPEASDSWIVFSAEQVHRCEQVEKPRRPRP